MISFTRILVNVDVTATEHPALARAAELAARCNAQVKIVDVLPEVPPRARGFVSTTLEEELVAHRRESLAAVAASVREVPVTTELLRGRPAIALIREVLRSGHDLLMRSHGLTPVRRLSAD